MATSQAETDKFNLSFDKLIEIIRLMNCKLEMLNYKLASLAGSKHAAKALELEKESESIRCALSKAQDKANEWVRTNLSKVAEISDTLRNYDT